MTTQIDVSSAYGVIIRNSEHEILQKLSKKFAYGEEEIDDALPASDILDGEIDYEKLDRKFPGLAAAVSGELLLQMNRSLVVFIKDSLLHVELGEGLRDAKKLNEAALTKGAQKELAKFCKKYGIQDEPGWVTWASVS